LKALYCSIISALVFLISTSSNVVEANIFDGLVSAWTFDGNLQDSVGWNHGEFMGELNPPDDNKPTGNEKPKGEPGPTNIADDVVSVWTFDGDTEDGVEGNDGEFMGELNPPDNNKPEDDPGPKDDPAPTNIADGIVSVWTFDDDTEDDVEDNDGEFNGAPAKEGPVYVDGKFGRAISFDGVDDYIAIPDDESLHLPEGLTVTAWINVNVSVNHGGIVAKHVMIGWGTNFSFRICTNTGTNLTWGRCNDGEQYFATDGVLPGTGRWVHVALTCMSPDAPTTQRAYVNGEDITDVTGQTSQIAAGPPFLIFEGVPVEIGVGRAQGGTVGNDMFYNGLIDEIGIWDRGLTVDEIHEVMDRGLPFSRSVSAYGKIATTWGALKK